MDGILLLDKPRGWTSHDAVDFLRRRLGQKKIGHAGTLDPLATGLLVMLLGAATKSSDKLMGLDKDYRGTIRLGTVTETWDLEGRVLSEVLVPAFTRETLEQVFESFRGEQTITPPVFSAIKTRGKRHYQLARRGILTAPPERQVLIEDFRVEDFVNPEISFFVRCSKGTYIRSLAHHVGEKLGCGACLSSLIRTRIGAFHLEDALNLRQLQSFSPQELQTHLKTP